MINDTEIPVLLKSKLYYGKYKYRANFYHPDIHLGRYATNARELDNAIDLRKNHGSNYYAYAAIYANKTLDRSLLDRVDRDFVLNFIQWRSTYGHEVGIRVDYNSVSVYSNDLELLATLEKLGSEVKYTQIQLTGSPNILLRRDPKHSYRTYFKSKTVPLDFNQEVDKFLSAYKNSAFPSGALKKWSTKLKGTSSSWRLRYLDASFFIEYDNESFQTVLALTFDQYLGKTYKVEQR